MINGHCYFLFNQILSIIERKWRWIHEKYEILFLGDLKCYKLLAIECNFFFFRLFYFIKIHLCSMRAWRCVEANKVMFWETKTASETKIVREKDDNGKRRMKERRVKTKKKTKKTVKSEETNARHLFTCEFEMWKRKVKWKRSISNCRRKKNDLKIIRKRHERIKVQSHHEERQFPFNLSLFFITNDHCDGRFSSLNFVTSHIITVIISYSHLNLFYFTLPSVTYFTLASNCISFFLPLFHSFALSFIICISIANKNWYLQLWCVKVFLNVLNSNEWKIFWFILNSLQCQLSVFSVSICCTIENIQIFELIFMMQKMKSTDHQKATRHELNRSAMQINI